MQTQSMLAPTAELNIVVIGGAATSGSEWQRRAIEGYRRQRPGAAASLRNEIAARVGRLIGRSIDVSTVVVDEQHQAALLTVDGVQFRWDRSELTIIRPCAHCGVGRFASPPIRDVRDLGYALSDWTPVDPHCEPFEPDEPL